MIPSWNHDGLLPPVNEANPTGPDRSPYMTDVAALVSRFAFNLQRCHILEGYLSHREKLHQLGLNEGFQWINGSFIEHIEIIENRLPNDIDVVTFLPQELTILEAFSEEDIRLLVDQQLIKNRFKVDFYVQSLRDDPESLVSMCAYWYGMWSHRRSMQWKGFLKVSLETIKDAEAKEILSSRIMEFANE